MTHRDKWFMCCGLGTKYQRYLHKQDRMKARMSIREEEVIYDEVPDEVWEQIDLDMEEHRLYERAALEDYMKETP